MPELYGMHQGSLISYMVCSYQGPISRGYSYTLQKNNGETWELTDSAGNKLTAPAICFMIPPTDPEALALVDRYESTGGVSMDWPCFHCFSVPLHSLGLPVCCNSLGTQAGGGRTIGSVDF